MYHFQNQNLRNFWTLQLRWIRGTSETLGRHYQLRAWGISSYSKALAEKRTTSGMEEDGIFQNKWY